MRRYDASCRYLAEHHPEALLALVRLPGQVTVTRALPPDVTTPNYVTDAVLPLRWNGQELILHVEFETEAKRTLPQRIFWYNAALAAKYRRPIYSVAVCLTRRRRPPADAYEFVFPDGRRHRLEYRVVRLWEEDARSALAVAPPGVLPFSVLMKGADARTLREAVQRIEEREPEAETRENLLTVLFVFAGLRFSRRLITTIVRRDKMRESVTYRDILREGAQSGFAKGHKRGLKQGLGEGLGQGLEQGLEQGLTQSLRTVLAARFGRLPAEVSRALAGLRTPAELQAGVRQAARVKDLAGFRAWLARHTTAR